MIKSNLNFLNNEKGFSLSFIFLFLVIILIALWIGPGYMRIHNLAQQKATRGALDNLRRGVNLFYAQRGHYPYNLEDLAPNYVYPFPQVRLGIAGYPVNRNVTLVMVDSGMWFYDDANGDVRIDCLAIDQTGEVIKNW